MKNFEDLVAWQEAVSLAKSIYHLTSTFPKQEQFGLTSQLRRAVISVSSNLAEGFGRFGQKDKERFYTIALGSLLEVRSQVLVSEALVFATANDIKPILSKITDVHKLINALISAQRKRV